MAHEEIIAMAREAGFDMSRLPSIRAANVHGEVNDELERFAALVAAKERGRFALECIDLVALHGGSVEIEAAIRSRASKGEV